MRYALVESDVVVNVILWDGKGEQFDGWLYIELDEDSIVGVGYTYSGGVFSPPEYIDGL